MLTLGFSPCPNDTFIFHALVHGLAGYDCPVFSPPELEDVETLNEWALKGRLDVTKISLHAFGHVMDKYVLLRSGSALGRGCGPLIVARKSLMKEDLSDIRIAIPGAYTTAAMLLKLYAPSCRNLIVKRFDEIMPSIAGGEVDAGVIIHESRFTYQEHGLICVEDLGNWWENETGQPIPLGGIAARRDLGDDVIQQIERCVRNSVRHAFANPHNSTEYTRKYAQELDEMVIGNHINLYVNSFSEDLGEVGMAAISEFLSRGKKAGIFTGSLKELSSNVFSNAGNVS
ncbi:MAG: 1,4-dihydroxy-6-naphthoate synthase [Desulfobulbaceae bacterium]|uniref:1,4-dihydroxy-6-naphtoate synthase n=1 Tax=Candidatus Desulfobia pelagia TaxID=2841692 RepID=A0A8J6NFB7_9BACT|nr:1,4-dihydroxy-6-naphthoate synthase [Candidatus Desulfobia pelagia]